MAVRKINESTLTAIGNAIRAKTGGSSLIAPEDMPTEIASIQTGGGGSLPSSISKIDGGSFTVASNTKCSTYEIATTLGVPAKYFIIWTDGLNPFGANTTTGLIQAVVNIRQYDTADGTTRYGNYSYIQRKPNGTAYASLTTMNYANNPATFTDSTMICYYVGDTYYNADITYKWVAMA